MSERQQITPQDMPLWPMEYFELEAMGVKKKKIPAFPVKFSKVSLSSLVRIKVNPRTTLDLINQDRPQRNLPNRLY